MTTPSREDFEAAADQMTEREKVVAWHRERGARARKNFDDRTYIFHDMCADAIERGDHSTATPVSAPDDRWPEAPRDEDWQRADEVRKKVDCWIYRGGEDHVVNTYARAFAALRMTEREKVVAFLKADAIEVLKDGMEDYAQALLDAAHAIAAGDHSSAKPAGEGR